MPAHIATGEARHVDPRTARRMRRLGVCLLSVLVVLAAVRVLVSWWTTWLAFDSMGYTSVLRTRWIAQAGLFAAGGLITAAAVGGSLAVAHRMRPLVVPFTIGEHGVEVDEEQLAMEGYREAFEPMRRRLWFLLSAIFSLFGAAIAAGQWKTMLAWANAAPFDQTDARFGHDIGFYVFTLPWIHAVLGFATLVLVLALLTGVVTHYMYGGLGKHLKASTGARTTRAARIHLAGLAVALLAVRAVATWMSRYDLLSSRSSPVTGLTYTSDHVSVPGRAALAVATACCAALFVVTIVRGAWRPAIAGVAVLAASALGLAVIAPVVVQHAQVVGQESRREVPYVERALTATARGFGLEHLTTTSVPGGGTGALTAQERAALDHLAQSDTLDPDTGARALEASQRGAAAYRVEAPLSTVSSGGRVQRVGSRTLSFDGLPARARSWQSEHLVHTHGYGLVVADGVTDAGAPHVVAGGIPPVGALASYEPRLYFGPGLPRYSVAGTAREVADATEAGARHPARYDGDGGVALNSWTRRAAYAITLGDRNLLSADLTDGARIISNRDPVERVRAVAPYLRTSSRAYPAVVSGRVQWIVDGFTTTGRYPGSAVVPWRDASSSSRPAGDDDVTYVRNSVKATVDAYSGEVTLYAWDENDPILATWRRVFGGTVKPLAQMSGELMAQMQYPQELFDLQRLVLQRYHARSAQEFLADGGQWSLPQSGAEDALDAAQMVPGEQGGGASGSRLVGSFVAAPPSEGSASAPAMTAYLTVDSDAGGASGRRAPTYGSLRLATLESASALSPEAFAASGDRAMNASTKTSLGSMLKQERAHGAVVSRGSVVTLPVGGRVVLLQTVSSQRRNITAPAQVAVVLGTGDVTVWAPTLPDAVRMLESRLSASPAGAQHPTQLEKALADARSAAARIERARAAHDDNGLREAQGELDTALDAASAAAGASS